MNLILFTLKFPYGKGEEFIETELHTISQLYEEILIVPTDRGGLIRAIPGNCKIAPAADTSKPSPAEAVRLVYEFFIYFIKDLFQERNTLKKIRALIVYWREFRMQFSRARSITLLLDKLPMSWRGAILYDFWMINNGIALALINKDKKYRVFANTHNYDLYDERWGCPLPFRSTIIRNLVAIFPDSKYGAAYLKNKISKDLHQKIRPAYMGVRDNGYGPVPSSEKHVVVSCSACTQHKRIDRIIDALSVVQHSFSDIDWIHFGDGPLHGVLLNRAKSELPRVRTDFRGWVKSAELTQFFQLNPVDCLIHTSEAEGLPVSLMIAAGFGVPIIALDAMGIPELIGEWEGTVHDQNISAADLGSELCRVIQTQARDQALRARIRQKSMAKFSTQNYIDVHTFMIEKSQERAEPQ